MNDVQLSLRLPKELLARAETLIPRLARLQAYRALRISRLAVLRMALDRGLLALEAEVKDAKHGTKA